MPLNQAAISYEVDGDQIDGVIVQPSPGEAPFPGVVVCHPHPLFGGDMNSPVVLAICSALARQGIASLRFNFRERADAGQLSESSARDVEVALQLLDGWELINSARIGVAGYSFGAAAIARACDRLKPARAFALVAPPVAAVRGSALGDDARPLYFVVGGKDRLVSPEDLSDAVAGMRFQPTFETIDGADHMLAGHERAIGERVADFLAGILQAGQVV